MFTFPLVTALEKASKEVGTSVDTPQLRGKMYVFYQQILLRY